MTLKMRSLSIILGALVIALVAVGCGERTSDILATSAAANRQENDLATRQAVIAAGGDPDATVAAAVGIGSRAELQRISTNATSTALAGASPTPTATAVVIDLPDGPVLTDADNPVVQMGSAGEFTPAILKVQVGTTVKWENPGKSAHSTTSVPDSEESWDSGAISKGAFSTEPASFSHTFMVTGCHQYASNFPGDTGTGAVCVVE